MALCLRKTCAGLLWCARLTECLWHCALGDDAGPSRSHRCSSRNVGAVCCPTRKLVSQRGPVDTARACDLDDSYGCERFKVSLVGQEVMENRPQHARIVIVGGGIVGCSTAYHLARLGFKDILLLEQGRLTFCWMGY